MERAALLVLVRALLRVLTLRLAAAPEPAAAAAAPDPELREVRAGLRQVESLLAGLVRQEAAPRPPPLDSAAVRALIHVRRFRPLHFGESFAGHSGWSLLLELFAAMLDGRPHSPASLAESCGVAGTTTLRWLARLEAAGLAVRRPDPEDARRALVELTPRAARSMHEYLSAAARAPMG